MFAFETGKYEMHTFPGPNDAYSGRKLSSVSCTMAAICSILREGSVLPAGREWQGRGGTWEPAPCFH
jgi:hypothetical protein